MDRWKEFEREMSASLKRLPGYSMRVEDGGNVSRNEQLCDFLYWDMHGHTFAIECKATKSPSFPLKNIRPHQLQDMCDFAEMHKQSHIALFAVNFWGPPKSDVYLIEATKMREYVLTSGRKSLPRADAAKIGKRMKEARFDKRRVWVLEDA